MTASYPRARDSGRGSSGRDSDPYYSGYSARWGGEEALVWWGGEELEWQDLASTVPCRVPAFVGEQRREQENRREQRASRRDERR